MSSTSSASLTSLQHRDIRSASLPFKRDKEKAHPEKRGFQVRTDYKSHANVNIRRTYWVKMYSHSALHRIHRKLDAIIDVNEHSSSLLSKSLIELPPQHANNKNSSIQTAIRDSKDDAAVLYSFENKGAFPTKEGRSVALSGLVELAEQKWANEQTERIVKVEYEVLNHQGETTVLKARKKKGSPKQRDAKSVIKTVEEDDGFELI